ncbi:MULTISPECIES: hypothetical protein [Nostocales]|uniref:Uncharacterized protein n=2 Tax=Nostocales TaxID=1161 RepID=A0ABW8WFU9_9CYAN|nr:hypothetical protein [Tolypothrix bouteillei]
MQNSLLVLQKKDDTESHRKYTIVGGMGVLISHLCDRECGIRVD